MSQYNNSLKQYIDEHTPEKGGLEFYLAKPTRRRNFLDIILVFVLVFLAFYFLNTLIIVFGKGVEYNHRDVFLLIALPLGNYLFFFAFDKILNRIYLQVNRTGIIKFEPNSILLKDISGFTIGTFDYSNIKKINYKLILPNSYLKSNSKRREEYKLYGFEFFFWEKDPIKVEIENEIIVPKDKYINRPKLSLFDVVKSINPKYGLWEV